MGSRRASALAAGDLDEGQAELGEGVLERVLVGAEPALAASSTRAAKASIGHPGLVEPGWLGRQVDGGQLVAAHGVVGHDHRGRAPTPAGRGPAASRPRSAGPRPPARAVRRGAPASAGPARAPGRSRAARSAPVDRMLAARCPQAHRGCFSSCSGSGCRQARRDRSLRNRGASLVPYDTQQPGKAGLRPHPATALRHRASGSMHRQRVRRCADVGFPTSASSFSARCGRRTPIEPQPASRRTCALMRSDRP